MPCFVRSFVLSFCRGGVGVFGIGGGGVGGGGWVAVKCSCVLPRSVSVPVVWVRERELGVLGVLGVSYLEYLFHTYDDTVWSARFPR